MARARNIKPSFFTNELLGTEDPMVSLTFAGLWCLADKVGVMEDRPLRIKAELFPYRESLDVNGYLTVLARLGFIVRYENDGRRFIQVCNFRKHQSPHNTEKGKGYPFYTDPKSLIMGDNGYPTVKAPCADGELTVPERPDSLIPDTGFTDSLIPEEKPLVPSGDGTTDYPPGFNACWDKYPRRLGGNPKKAAFKAWNARIRSGVPESDLLLAVERYASDMQSSGKVGTEYVKQAATFFGPDEHWRESLNAGPAASLGSKPGRPPLAEGQFYHPDWESGSKVICHIDTHDRDTGYSLEYMRKRGML